MGNIIVRHNSEAAGGRYPAESRDPVLVWPQHTAEEPLTLRIGMHLGTA